MINNDLEIIRQQEYDKGRTAGVNLVWKQTREEIEKIQKETENIQEALERYIRLSEDLEESNDELLQTKKNLQLEIDRSNKKFKAELEKYIYLGPKPEKTILISNTEIRRVVWNVLSSRWPDGGPTKVNCSHNEYLVPSINWLHKFWASLPAPPIYEIGKFDCSRMIESLINRMNWAGNGEFPIGKLIVQLPSGHADVMAITLGFSGENVVVPTFGVWENNFYREEYRPPKNEIFFELPPGIVVLEVNV